MNGLKILNQALALMGVSQISEEVRKMALYMINVVCEDLGIKSLISIEDKFSPLSRKELTALTYGVATRLAVSMGDDYLKSIFEKDYNQKRSEIKSSVLKVKNSIFKGEVEGE